MKSCPTTRQSVVERAIFAQALKIFFEFNEDREVSKDLKTEIKGISNTKIGSFWLCYIRLLNRTLKFRSWKIIQKLFRSMKFGTNDGHLKKTTLN